MLDGVRDGLAADVEQRPQGQIVGLCRGRDPLVGIEAQRHASGGGQHDGLDGLDDRLAIAADQAADHVASAGESAFARRDHDARLRRRDRIVGERSCRREREREILHDQVVHIGGHPAPLVRERLGKRPRTGCPFVPACGDHSLLHLSSSLTFELDLDPVRRP